MTVPASSKDFVAKWSLISIGLMILRNTHFNIEFLVTLDYGQIINLTFDTRVA